MMRRTLTIFLIILAIHEKIPAAGEVIKKE